MYDSIIHVLLFLACEYNIDVGICVGPRTKLRFVSFLFFFFFCFVCVSVQAGMYKMGATGTSPPPSFKDSGIF